MSRKVKLVLLCEDSQHDTFLRRFLKALNWDTREMRVARVRAGMGSGEQFVRTRLPIELKAYRQNRNRVAYALVVMIDGDNQGVKGRIQQLTDECREFEICMPQKGEKVAVFVPTWNIETWLAYLDDQDVDERKADYPRLERPRECKRHASVLAESCRSGELRQPAPASLEAACHEYGVRLRDQ
ncbi:MAG: hypothetical protein OXH79_21655 [Boseongicola sp.]|nr:hypothetical protein [Boseongicola sp.]